MTQLEIFSRNLNYHIHNSHKTQKEVANAIGVLPATLNTWTQGKNIPRMDKIQLLADYFHIKKSDLVDEPVPAAAGDEPVMINTSYSRRYDNLIRTAEQLNDDGLTALEGNAKLFLAMPEYRRGGEDTQAKLYSSQAG